MPPHQKEFKNRRAFHEYHVLEKVEAGIALVGSEVKSIREGNLNLSDSYMCRDPDAENPVVLTREWQSNRPGIPDTGPLGTLGDYTLRRQRGRGGMGVVYEAWQGSMERRVALKALPPGVAADNKAFHRFMREAKTAVQLSHQNIVAVYSTGVEEGTPWYSMELVEGETLAQIFTKTGEADDQRETPFGKKSERPFYLNLAKGFAEVADGLQHEHSRGVIHRDIKPSPFTGDNVRDGKRFAVTWAAFCLKKTRLPPL